MLLSGLISGCAAQTGAHYDQPRSSGHSATTESSSYEPSSLQASNDDALEDALHEYYEQWHGVPYQYGGRDMDGIDCSAFARQTLDSVESLNLPRTTLAQAARGTRVDRDNLTPGDLVFFKTGGSSRHVGVYIGNGRFMHASTSRGVTISRLNNIYWRHHYWQSRRVISATR